MARRVPKPQPLALSLDRVLALLGNDYRARNLSEQTVAWYEKRIGHFVQWFTAEFKREPTLADLSAATFQLFILEKQGTGKYQNHPFHAPQEAKPSSAHIHGYYRVFRAFGGWIKKNKLWPDNPLADIDLPKLDEKELRPLTAEEERRLLDAYSEGSANGCRSKAIFMLMLDTGLRRSEVVRLKFEDVDLKDGFLLVKGKGNKERSVPFGFKTGTVMARYGFTYRPEPATGQIDTFFLDPDGYPMTVNAIKMLFARAAKKTKIARLHPHLLRHTYGIRSQEMNIPSLTLQRYMGHSDVRTTERYAHAAQSEKIKRERGFSHLDQLPVKVKKSSSTSRRKP